MNSCTGRFCIGILVIELRRLWAVELVWPLGFWEHSERRILFGKTSTEVRFNRVFQSCVSIVSSNREFQSCVSIVCFNREFKSELIATELILTAA